MIAFYVEEPQTRTQVSNLENGSEQLKISLEGTIPKPSAL